MGPAGAALGTTLSQAHQRGDRAAGHPAAQERIPLQPQRFSPRSPRDAAAFFPSAFPSPCRTASSRLPLSSSPSSPISAGLTRRGGGGHCGEDHQLPLPGALVHAVLGVGAWGRRIIGAGQARAGAAARCGYAIGDRGGVRRWRRPCVMQFWAEPGGGAVHRCRGAADGAAGDPAGRRIPAGLRVGLCVRRHPLQLQRLLLRLRPVGTLVSAQSCWPSRWCGCPGVYLTSTLFPGHAVPHGPCHGVRARWCR